MKAQLRVRWKKRNGADFPPQMWFGACCSRKAPGPSSGAARSPNNSFPDGNCELLPPVQNIQQEMKFPINDVLFPDVFTLKL